MNKNGVVNILITFAILAFCVAADYLWPSHIIPPAHTWLGSVIKGIWDNSWPWIVYFMTDPLTWIEFALTAITAAIGFVAYKFKRKKAYWR